MAEEEVLILSEEMYAEGAPAEPSIVDSAEKDERAVAANEDIEDVVDENLIALADAELQIAAAEVQGSAGTQLTYPSLGPRALAARRKRGNVVWGAIALGLAVHAWILPFVASFWRRLAVFNWTPWLELGLLLGAVVFGTIGCRRVAGKKMAIVGRLMAWTAPTVALVLEAVFGSGSIGVLPAIAALGLWTAIGVFIFAIFDAILEP